MKAAADTCTVLCGVTGGIQLMERSGLGSGSTTETLTLKQGRNRNVPRSVVERFRDASLTIFRIPFTNVVFVIDKD